MKNKVIIIAEAGVNHNGDYELARKLILEAANAGADYVKFQTFKAEKLVSKDAQKADYQKDNLKENGDTQYEMLKKLEMSEEWHYNLMKYANECNIKFLSTGFDEESIDFLDTLKIDLFKIPSGEITNKPLLTHIAKKGRPVVISTGMATMNDIYNAIQVLLDNGISKNTITILHCNTEYPTPMNDVNLSAMNKIKEEFNVNIGYSDHTLGIEVPIAAVALGAKIIEKHFTLDKNMEGPDHKASLDPSELSLMVKSIRNISNAIGTGIKTPSISEIKNLNIARKSIHIKKNVFKGDLVSKEDLIMLRPGDGISPMDIDLLINKKYKSNFSSGYKLNLNDLE
jgi:N,N'-diacetyllegionaminate synthase